MGYSVSSAPRRGEDPSDLTTNPASPPRRRTWGVVALDEAQKIKNRDTEVSNKCKLLPRNRAWALTGTPLENSVEELPANLRDLAERRGKLREFRNLQRQPRKSSMVIPAFRIRARRVPIESSLC